MYFLRTKASFDAAHFLKDYEGKCKNIHGHRWKVIVEIAKETLETEGPKRGMVLDFGDLKAVLKELCNELDHSLIYESGSLKKTTVQALQEEDFRMIEVPFIPTAENFAKYFFDQMKERQVPVHRVEVYETPNNFAAYEE
ncbi:MAG: 6-carboxytetrahydropterin synthase QueD [Eubacterium sp.]|nr:6-carboxytetrahydropterin synthase QueD [Eubacterium sp.]